MSFGFCGCFKPTTQVTGGEARTNPKRVNKPIPKEIDLLDMNARRNQELGMSRSPDRSRNTNQFDITNADSEGERRSAVETTNGSLLTKQRYNQTASRNDEARMVSYSRHHSVQMEEFAAKAIDDFMRSPKKRKSEISPVRSEMNTPGVSPILSNKQSPVNAKRASNQVSSASYKKTGVAISKCFEMLCGRCGKRFSSKPPEL